MVTWPMVQVIYLISVSSALGCVNSVETCTLVYNLHLLFQTISRLLAGVAYPVPVKLWKQNRKLNFCYKSFVTVLNTVAILVCSDMCTYWHVLLSML